MQNWTAVLFSLLAVLSATGQSKPILQQVASYNCRSASSLPKILLDHWCYKLPEYLSEICGYNATHISTDYPNAFGATSMREAISLFELGDFECLIYNLAESGCQHQIVQFVCMTIFPMCIEYESSDPNRQCPMQYRIVPCAGLCASTRNKCSGLLETPGTAVEWPAGFSCDLHVSSSSQPTLCMPEVDTQADIKTFPSDWIEKAKHCRSTFSGNGEL